MTKRKGEELSHEAFVKRRGQQRILAKLGGRRYLNIGSVAYPIALPKQRRVALNSCFSKPIDTLVLAGADTWGR